jgi:hypothetical protein
MIEAVVGTVRHEAPVFEPGAVGSYYLNGIVSE